MITSRRGPGRGAASPRDWTARGRSMSWEYEDLFNNRITGDGSFLEEPSFIAVGRMGLECEGK